MTAISYGTMAAGITALWILVRGIACARSRSFQYKREAQLLLVYICLLVVVRCTFCPFETVNGKIQPLLFDPEQLYPFRINLIPFVNLLDYPELRPILLNVIGNTAMFLPIGIIFPSVFRELNTHGKTIAAGVGLSLTIEILQLPFFDRVTDIDDLILNSLGYLLGYGIFLLLRKRRG